MLDGNLHAVSKKSGSIKWTLKEGKKIGVKWNFVVVCIALKTQEFTLAKNTKGALVLPLGKVTPRRCSGFCPFQCENIVKLNKNRFDYQNILI